MKIVTREDWLQGALVKLAINNPYLTADAKLDDYLFNLQYAVLRNVEYHFADLAPSACIVPALAAAAVASEARGAWRSSSWRQARLDGCSSRSTARFAGRTSATRCPRSRGSLMAAALGVSALVRSGCARGRRSSSAPRLGALIVQLYGVIAAPPETRPDLQYGWLFALAVAGPVVLAVPLRPARVLAAAAALVLFHDHQASKMRDQKWFFGRASRNIRDQHIATGRGSGRAAGLPRDGSIDRDVQRCSSATPARIIVRLRTRPGSTSSASAATTRSRSRAPAYKGLAATIELMEHLPPAELPRRPRHLPELVGHPADVVLGRGVVAPLPRRGNVICGGYEDVVYRADWHLLDTGEATRASRPGRRDGAATRSTSPTCSARSGTRVRLRGPATAASPSSRCSADPADPDEGHARRRTRAQARTTERFVFARLDAGPTRRTSSSARRPEKRRRCASASAARTIAPRRLRARATAWVEPVVRDPGAARRRRRSTSTLANEGPGDFVDYHVWVDAVNGATRLAALLGTWGSRSTPGVRGARPGRRSRSSPVRARRARRSASPDLAAAPHGARERARLLVLRVRRRVPLARLRRVLPARRAAHHRRDDATSSRGARSPHGHFAWSVPDPSASFRGRFLLFRRPAELAGIFPPGYPLLLSLRGSASARRSSSGRCSPAALVVRRTGSRASWRRRRLDAPSARRSRRSPRASRSSCAALRYHTADTMAHGASRARRSPSRSLARAARRAARAGCPWLVRWLAGLARRVGRRARGPSRASRSAAWSSSLAARSGARRPPLPALVLGTLPGVAFLVARAAARRPGAGSPRRSAPTTPRATAPRLLPLRLRAQASAASASTRTSSSRGSRTGTGRSRRSRTTLRRLRVHLLDVANFEPLALLVVVPLLRRRAGAPGVIGRGRLAPPWRSRSWSGRSSPTRRSTSTATTRAAARASSPTCCRSSTRSSRSRRACLLPRVAFFRARARRALPRRPGLRRARRVRARRARRTRRRPAHVRPRGGARARPRGCSFFDTDAGFNLAYDPYAEPCEVGPRRPVPRRRSRPAPRRPPRPPAGARLQGRREGGEAQRLDGRARRDEGPVALRGRGRLAAPHAGGRMGRGRVGEQLVRDRGARAHAARRAGGPGAEAQASTTISSRCRAPASGSSSPHPAQGGPGAGPAAARPARARRAPLRCEAGVGVEGRRRRGEAGARHVPSSRDGDRPRGGAGCGGAEWELTATGGDVSLDQTTLRATR